MRATIPSNMPRGISGYKSPNKSSYITNYNKYKHESYNVTCPEGFRGTSHLTKVVTLLIITSTSMRATIPSNMSRGVSGYKSPYLQK